ncbi:hypothetical protein HHK36_017881 [Tetracentron sinense]|uniref:Protein FAR1-RELATED SEQUENCE n=1 Tax=Tetracentron sinense TaxID=13715 RepID=A0A834Z0H1_TETSI|nr:hypothetical protein HHK36_017881 [Tetracentron sinense]
MDFNTTNYKDNEPMTEYEASNEEGNEVAFDEVDGTKLYFPNVSLDQKPYVGMEFESIELSYDHYNAYARISGFSVRKDSSRYGKDTIQRRFVCSNQGTRHQKWVDRVDAKKEPKSVTRTGCAAKLEVIQKNEKCIVHKFVEGHNHALNTPSKRHILRSSKKMTENSKRLIKSWNDSGLRLSQCHNLMANEAGGYKNLGFDEVNMRGVIRRSKAAMETYGTDAGRMMDYFRGKQQENPSFFYSVQLDSAGQLCFKDKWDKCIYGTQCPEEFEQFWNEMIQEFNLQEVDWLNTMWRERRMWMPVYLRDTFFAGMSTTQRSESMNSFFKDWVNMRTSLIDFVKRYDMALQKRREHEVRQDYKSLNEQPYLRINSNIERQLANVLTRKIFKKFQPEYVASQCCYGTLVRHEGLEKKYEVRHESNLKKAYIVSFIETGQSVQCICKKFEFEGIVCKHMFCVLKLEHISKLPPHYIMKRWTKDAKTGFVGCDHGIQESFKKTVSMRYTNLMYWANKIALSGAIYERTHDMVENLLKKGLLESEKINKEEETHKANKQEASGVEDVDISDSVDINASIDEEHIGHNGSSQTITILDPKLVKTKGSGKRISRVCRICKKPKHDSRNCPNK